MSVFNDLKKKKLFASKHFFAVLDGFPVSKGHMLIISNREVETFFDLSPEEHIDLTAMIINAKAILDETFSPDGYNIGMNCGEAAGQTVMHFHAHVIPRYKFDSVNPKGGVRHCIPGISGYYNVTPDQIESFPSLESTQAYGIVVTRCHDCGNPYQAIQNKQTKEIEIIYCSDCMQRNSV